MVRDEALLRRGHNNQSRRGHQCSETTLTTESRFHIRGFEPGFWHGIKGKKVSQKLSGMDDGPEIHYTS
jgi:hypothetical protein